ALRNAHLSGEEIKGSRLVVSPRWDYESHRPKRIGYQAVNTIDIETTNLSQLGAVIDAALSAGATDVSEITFLSKKTDEARRRALGQAVGSARADAEAMARAGGGALGDLLLVSTERTNEAPGVELQEVVVTAGRRAAVPTDVAPSQIKVTARV